MVFIQDGNAESVQFLVEGGANIDARNARGQSALHLAALAQSPETVEFLLKSGESIPWDVMATANQRWFLPAVLASRSISRDFPSSSRTRFKILHQEDRIYGYKCKLTQDREYIDIFDF